MWKHFQSLSIPPAQATQARRRFSVTADILAFQQCSLQYGAFSARKYEPALVLQLFYGTIIHQVLDRAHAHFRGELGAPGGSLPDDADIESYFGEVENALRARRIRAGDRVREQALRILKRFNSLEGPSLYPRRPRFNARAAWPCTRPIPRRRPVLSSRHSSGRGTSGRSTARPARRCARGSPALVLGELLAAGTVTRILPS